MEVVNYFNVCILKFTLSVLKRAAASSRRYLQFIVLPFYRLEYLLSQARLPANPFHWRKPNKQPVMNAKPPGPPDGRFSPPGVPPSGGQERPAGPAPPPGRPRPVPGRPRPAPRRAAARRAGTPAPCRPCRASPRPPRRHSPAGPRHRTELSDGWKKAESRRAARWEASGIERVLSLARSGSCSEAGVSPSA